MRDDLDRFGFSEAVERTHRLGARPSKMPGMQSSVSSGTRAIGRRHHYP